jgi:hypothetical protein
MRPRRGVCAAGMYTCVGLGSRPVRGADCSACQQVPNGRFGMKDCGTTGLLRTTGYPVAADPTILEELTLAWTARGRSLTHLQISRALGVLDGARN